MKLKLKKSTVNSLITYALLIIGFAVMQIMITNGSMSRQMESLLIPLCINVILAVSLNLVVGFLGELSLGHAGFMSVGAYAGCLFSIHFENALPTMIRYPLALLVAGLVAAVFGVIIGIPVLRLNGDYLAIVTLAFGEIIRSVVINLNFTGGASGLKGIPGDSTFIGSFIVVMITVIIISNFVNSKDGRAIKSLKDNKIAAKSCGINTNYYKLLAFVVSAFFAGVAGGIFGHNLPILTAGTFDYNKSIAILVMVVLGGMGSIRGSIIAAIVLTVLPEALRFLSEYRMLIYALVLIVLMIFNSSDRFKGIRDKLTFKNLFFLIKNGILKLLSQSKKKNAQGKEI